MAAAWGCKVWAHRCGSSEFPENTVFAICHALGLGVDGVEFDVRLTKDGVPVVIHDSTVDQTTDGTGQVSQMTLCQLKTLDAAYRFRRGGRYPYRGRGITVPTLEDALRAAKGVAVNIEMKGTDPRLPEIVASAIHRHGDPAATLVASAHGGQLRRFVRASKSGVRTAASPMESLAWLLFGCRRDISAVEIPWKYRGVDLYRIVRCRASRTHPRVLVWTVNGRGNINRWISLGIYGILTDEPSLALRIRARKR